MLNAIRPSVVRMGFVRMSVVGMSVVSMRVVVPLLFLQKTESAIQNILWPKSKEYRSKLERFPLSVT